MARPPESTFAEGAVSVLLSASSHETSPYNAQGSIFIVPPGRGIRKEALLAHASAALRIVPSPPSTMKTSSFCPAASEKKRSISVALPHQAFGSTMPVRLRIRSIFSSDSKSQPPLEVLITAPTFNSVKGSALGTNHVCVAGKVLVARLKMVSLLDARSARLARFLPSGLSPFSSAFLRTRSNCFSRLLRSSSASFSRSIS